MENLFYFGSLLIAAIVVFRYYRSSDTDSDWNAVAKHEQQFDRWQAWIKRHIDNDQIPQIICGSSPLCHDADEEVVAVLPSVDLLEPRAVRYSRSYYGGPTIRIAKGLSLRLGAASGRSESQDELRTLDHGTLVLTTKRLAFMGSMRTNNVSLDDIVTVEPYADGIRLHRERKERPETYIFTRELKFADGSGADLSVSGGSLNSPSSPIRTRAYSALLAASSSRCNSTSIAITASSRAPMFHSRRAPARSMRFDLPGRA